MFCRWDQVTTKVGLGPVHRSAFTFEEIKRGNGAGKYIAKWGAGAEIARGSDKRGRQSGQRVPWELLADNAEGDKQAGALFIEYAKAFKGARHLTWCRGLKARYEIGDKDDLEIAATTEEVTFPPSDGGLIQKGQKVRVDVIDEGAWRLIAKKELTAAVLDTTFSDGWAGVLRLLGSHGIHPITALWLPPQPPS